MEYEKVSGPSKTERMYFIQYVHAYSNLNKKSTKIAEKAMEFSNFLIKNEIALESLKKELGDFVKQCNSEDTRSREIEMRITSHLK